MHSGNSRPDREHVGRQRLQRAFVRVQQLRRLRSLKVQTRKARGPNPRHGRRSNELPLGVASCRARKPASRACLQRVADWGRLAHVGEMRRLDVTDAQWQRLEPLLPPEKPRTGRPNHDHRRVVSGMLWIHRTGAPWRDLPERYGPVGTVSSRFYRWCRAGVWDRILCALQAEADARGEIDWDLHFVDATIVRAHQHAAGARRTGAVGG